MVGKKRHFQYGDISKIKRQKIDEMVGSGFNIWVESKPHIGTSESEKEYADYMHSTLFSYVELLKSPALISDSSRPDVAWTALSMLCIAFCRYPDTDLSQNIFQQMNDGIPWMSEQAKQGSLKGLDICIFLEGLHCILCLQSPTFMENKLSKDEGDYADAMNVLLKLPWTQPQEVTGPHPLWKAKCISIQVMSKLCPSLNPETHLDVLDWGLNDEAEEVRIEAVIAMPVIVLSCGLVLMYLMMHVFKRLE